MGLCGSLRGTGDPRLIDVTCSYSSCSLQSWDGLGQFLDAKILKLVGKSFTLKMFVLVTLEKLCTKLFVCTCCLALTYLFSVRCISELFAHNPPHQKQEKQCTGQLQVRIPWGVCFGGHDPISFYWSTKKKTKNQEIVNCLHLVIEKFCIW